jgi:hypothetical protein
VCRPSWQPEETNPSSRRHPIPPPLPLLVAPRGCHRKGYAVPVKGAAGSSGFGFLEVVWRKALRWIRRFFTGGARSLLRGGILASHPPRCSSPRTPSSPSPSGHGSRCAALDAPRGSSSGFQIRCSPGHRVSSPSDLGQRLFLRQGRSL